MTTTTDREAITQKTLELCQVILEQPQIQMMRRDIDHFLADESARAQYQRVTEKGELLQQKQHSAEPLSQAEIDDFEKERQALVENAVARGFIDAQREFHQIQQSIVQYVTKTFEVGRLPEAEDFNSCGHGCSCGH